MTMAEGSDPMGNVGHRHMQTSAQTTAGLVDHQATALFLNQSVAWKQRKRKRLSAVLDKLHSSNNSSNSNTGSSHSPPPTVSAVQLTTDAEAAEHRATPTTESSEDDKSEVYSAPGSSPRITISPLRLAELDDNLNNNNNNGKLGSINNNNYPEMVNKNTLFNYPGGLSSHFLSQISPGLHIKSEFPSPPHHSYLPLASPLYYLQSRLPELLKRPRSATDSIVGEQLEQQPPQKEAPKNVVREEKRKREPESEAPLDLSMKPTRSATASPQSVVGQKENLQMLDEEQESPFQKYVNFYHGAGVEDEEVSKEKRRRNSCASVGSANNNNNSCTINNNYQQYNYQQSPYLAQHPLLSGNSLQNTQLHLDFLQNKHHQAEQQFLAKLSSPSPSSWSHPSLTPPQSRPKASAAEKRAAKAAKAKQSQSNANYAAEHQLANQGAAKGTATLIANILPSGSVGVPIIKGDVASPTTKESVASRYNLDVFPVVEEMPPGSDVAYVCPVCGQMFSLHDRLAKHMASRHKSKAASQNDITKAYGCDVCHRSFARSDMLTRHMRLHTGVKPYTCKVCGQVFSRSDHLSTHQRTHTGEKPYKCPQCPYAACRRDMITRHMRTHSRFEGPGSQGGAPSPADIAVAAAAAAAAGMHPFGGIKMEPMLGGMMGAIMGDQSPPVSPYSSGSASPPPPTPNMAIVKTESAV